MALAYVHDLGMILQWERIKTKWKEPDFQDWLAAGGLPETSKPHLERHEATTHLLVTPEEIRFRSDCPNSEAYLEARRFVTWLEDEVDFMNKTGL